MHAYRVVQWRFTITISSTKYTGKNTCTTAIVTSSTAEKTYMVSVILHNHTLWWRDRSRWRSSVDQKPNRYPHGADVFKEVCQQVILSDHRWQLLCTGFARNRGQPRYGNADDRLVVKINGARNVESTSLVCRKHSVRWLAVIFGRRVQQRSLMPGYLGPHRDTNCTPFLHDWWWKKERQ